VSAHVQPARNFQGVSSAPGSAQHERSVQDVSFASGRRPQLQRLGDCTESCTVQNTSLVFEQRAQRACTQITTRAAHAHDLEAELIQVSGWDASSDSEGCRSSEGSDFEGKNEGEGCHSPEGSDFAAEAGHEQKVSRIRARTTHRGYDETVCGYDKTVRCARFQGSVLVKRVKDTTRQSLRKVSSVATFFIIIIPGVSAVLGCV
jgi:hypothetical protein